MCFGLFKMLLSAAEISGDVFTWAGQQLSYFSAVCSWRLMVYPTFKLPSGPEHVFGFVLLHHKQLNVAVTEEALEARCRILTSQDEQFSVSSWVSVCGLSFCLFRLIFYFRPLLLNSGPDTKRKHIFCCCWSCTVNFRRNIPVFLHVTVLCQHRPHSLHKPRPFFQK